MPGDYRASPGAHRPLKSGTQSVAMRTKMSAKPSAINMPTRAYIAVVAVSHPVLFVFMIADIAVPAVAPTSTAPITIPNTLLIIASIKFTK